MSHIQTFTLAELLSLLGAAQCIYVLLYMVFRSGRLSRGTLPAVYFLVLGLAFILDAAQRVWDPLIDYYEHYQWLFWFAGPPLSMLLVTQIAKITQLPRLENYLILLLIPVAYLGALLFSSLDSDCTRLLLCDNTLEWLYITGLTTGGISLLAIWLKREMMDGIHKQVGGKERFWLIMALISLNVAFLASMLFLSWGKITEEEAHFIRGMLGIAFIYTASTSLLRIYPQAMRVQGNNDDELSDDEIAIAQKIEKLVYTEKVYQEPSYGRGELAKELGISESVLSRIVNMHFDKSVPQLLNDERVKDAQLLLVETEAAIKIIAQEAGFNSIASFNRVFKETTGQSPSDYRKKNAA